MLAQFDEKLVSAIEHPCVMEPSRGVGTIPVASSGVADVAWLGAELSKRKPALVAVMAANNETGVLQLWREVHALCCKAGVPFFCDAAQWIGKLPASGLGTCDFVSGCAHKFGGPQGVGFLKCPRDFKPLLRGGPQENGRRAGTENIAGVLAMVAALEEREAAMSTAAARAAWRDDFEKELCSALPGAQVMGAEVERLWSTSSIIMPGQPDCRRRWVVVMDRLGFAVSTGSACASGKEKPSHVLTAMNIQPDAAGRALRFSAGWETTSDDWARLLEGVKSAAREMGCA